MNQVKYCDLIDCENNEDARSGHRMVVINDILYVIGGFNPDLKNPIVEGIRRYSITENRWLETKRPTGTPSKTLASHAAVAHGHFILVHGGSGIPFGFVETKSLYAYDTVHHSWLLLDENVSKENELPRGLYGHTINVINGYVYLFGGTSGTFYFNTIYRFDLYEKKKWETVFEDANDNSSNVPIGRYRHETAVYHDFLVVIGGGEQLRVFDINELYFFDSNSFEWIKVLVGPDKRLKELHPEAPWCHQPADRKCHTLNQVGDYVYITGGQYIDRTMESSNLPDIWRVNLNPRKVSKDEYDPNKEVLNWEFVGFMPYEVFFHSSAFDENSEKIFVFGGNVMEEDHTERTNLFSALAINPSKLSHIAKTALHEYKNERI